MWETAKLGDLLSIKHGFAFEGEFFEESGEYVLLTPGNISLTGGLKITGKEKSYSGQFPKSFVFEKGDLVVVMTDLIQDAPILGGAFQIPESGKFLHNQRLGLVSVNELADKNFLYYVLNSEMYRGQVRGSATGSTVRHTAPERIYQCKFPLPPLLLQQQIAAVLGRYDTLLENYQQQMRALEGLAQEVYQEWFVRGRCPRAEAGPEGELPAGWRIATLDEVAYDTRRIVKIDDIDPDAAYVGLEHLSVRSISITATGTPDDISSDKLAFEENDILFGKIRAYLHKVCLAHFAGVCSTDAIVVRPRIEDALSFVLFTVFSERFIEYADLISNGTKMPRSEWSVLKTYQIILPDNKALAAFDEVARPMLDKIANLQKQSNYLRATRDALLPRLLSGQLTVHEAEATLAA